MTTTSDEVSDALAVSVHTMDAARRVGWAKAFNALARVEALEEQVRQQRAEMRALRRAYTRLVAFTAHVEFSGQTMCSVSEIGQHRAAVDSFRDAEAWRAGSALADRHNVEVRGDASLLDQMKQDGADRKEQRAELARKAIRLGHTVEVGEQDRKPAGRRRKGLATLDQAICTCGQDFVESTQGPSATQWKWEHLAVVVARSEAAA